MLRGHTQRLGFGPPPKICSRIGIESQLERSFDQPTHIVDWILSVNAILSYGTLQSYRDFSNREFALVPFAAARAIIEIKRTLSTRQKLLDQLCERRKLIAQRKQILGVVVTHPSPLFDSECAPDWLSQHGSEPAMTRLLDNDNRPDTDGIMAFIYFLAQIAGHNRVVLSASSAK